MSELHAWERKGFARSPEYRISVGDELVFRVSGRRIGEPGQWFSPLECPRFAFFEAEAFGAAFNPPRSVLEAELRLNIALYGNRAFHLGTYRIRPDVGYWIGRVAHDARDDSRVDRTAIQIYFEYTAVGKVDRVKDFVPLRQDSLVYPSTGNS